MDVRINTELVPLWHELFPDTELPKNFTVVESKNCEYGDYYTNICLKLRDHTPETALEKCKTLVEAWNAKFTFARASHRSGGFVNFRAMDGTRIQTLEVQHAFGNKTTEHAPVQLKPIGVVRTPFKSKYGTPRQGLFVPHAIGKVELRPEFNNHWLQGLDEYSHCWLIFLFHQNAKPAGDQPGGEQPGGDQPGGDQPGGDQPGGEQPGGDQPGGDQPGGQPGSQPGSQHTSCCQQPLPDSEEKPAGNPSIRVPKARGRIGTFATRSPHRPCPIGLSLCEIQRVEDKVVWLTGVDLVDGTPLLDLKPYHPLDNVNYTHPEYVQPHPPCRLNIFGQTFYAPAVFNCPAAPLIVEFHIVKLIRPFLAKAVGMNKAKKIQQAGTKEYRELLDQTLSQLAALENADPKTDCSGNDDFVQKVWDAIRIIDSIGEKEKRLRMFTMYRSLSDFIACIIESVRLDPRDKTERNDRQGKRQRSAHTFVIDNYEIVFHIGDATQSTHHQGCDCSPIIEQRPVAIIDAITYDA
ncbi:putative bacterial YaeB-like protein [Gregarina niphandrodes]|uniref:Bacterial YaeB-like protein n=1 Tax=Gregarina niphandrodes TaxID=110365 RepID=A0A023AZN6_GRENI|nr:putative bacterial YaeB-like protein [Gregarina niphandrodes]EZG44253.1 putative bacterial YaeB-like protein [Gregarina niphandrodes]|eukprot:XP_011132746.1 putative bacterial YaeB-like protein [Gregarina niphandrodes]